MAQRAKWPWHHPEGRVLRMPSQGLVVLIPPPVVVAVAVAIVYWAEIERRTGRCCFAK